MSTDREALALESALHLAGLPWVEAQRIAAVVIAAGWMPRPEPGSAEWEEMVGKGARAIWDQPGSGCSWERLTHAVRGQCIADAAACLRAALGTGDTDAE